MQYCYFQNVLLACRQSRFWYLCTVLLTFLLVLLRSMCFITGYYVKYPFKYIFPKYKSLRRISRKAYEQIWRNAAPNVIHASNLHLLHRSLSTSINLASAATLDARQIQGLSKKYVHKLSAPAACGRSYGQVFSLVATLKHWQYSKCTENTND